MITESEGIILRHTNIAGGRQMLVLLTKKFGKISAGAYARQGKKSNTLAMRPFTRGQYELYKKGSFFNINSAETIKSYYLIGEDVDRYMAAGFVLELTDKLLEENQQAAGVYMLLVDFLEAMNRRKKKYETLVCAYEIKVLKQLGYMPQLDRCVLCGEESEKYSFSIKDGGLICKNCRKKQENSHPIHDDALIYDIDFVIVSVVRFLESTPFHKLEKLAMQDDLTARVEKMMREYIKYHFDIKKFHSENLEW